jgi:type I restriction enzyme S subunit
LSATDHGGGPLPPGWTRAFVGDVVAEYSPGFACGKHNSEGEGIPHLRPMNVNAAGEVDLSVIKSVAPETDARRLRTGDVLFNNTNSSTLVGKTASFRLPGEMAFSNHMTRLRPAPNIDERFLARQLHLLWMQGYFRLLCSHHVNQASVASEVLAETVPVVVAPGPEQQRIADRIDELFSDLDAGVKVLERVRNNLERYRASVLKAAIEGRLTVDWRKVHADAEPASELLKRILEERRRRWEETQLAKFRAENRQPPGGWQAKYKEPIPPDTAELPTLPENWCWATVEQVGDVKLGRQRAPEYHRGEHMRQYLRVANVYEGRIDTTDVLSMEFSPAEACTFSLQFGDILLNEGQSEELVGRPAMYRDDLPGACFQNTLIRFRAYDGVKPEYALILCRAYLRNGRFRKSARITTNIAHLGAQRFARIEFPLPPSDEQAAAVDVALECESLIQDAEAKTTVAARRATGLRQAILRRAFEGRLVPQDPHDEPAERLLDRITAVRAVAAKEIRRRRNAS